MTHAEIQTRYEIVRTSLRLATSLYGSCTEAAQQALDELYTAATEQQQERKDKAA